MKPYQAVNRILNKEFFEGNYDKKSAERPLSDVQTGAPRNENRFASSNRHRTKKKRLAFSRTLNNLP
ncbi:hypothetical protein CQJ30_03870 [Caldibacillus thermoamylovorans]|nr:hypothetical protein CQJ30_03870 [Caldibacillus thermoamylovorans]